jgi:transposase-like protein
MVPGVSLPVLGRVHLVIFDAHAGLKAAVAQQFSGSSWQRCRVHFMRNLHTTVAAKHAPAVTAAVKAIFAHTHPAEVAARWGRVADTLAGSFPKVPTMMGEATTDVLAFTAFPKAHWQKTWSNNPIERLNKEIKRRAGWSSPSRSRLLPRTLSPSNITPRISPPRPEPTTKPLTGC